MVNTHKHMTVRPATGLFVRTVSLNASSKQGPLACGGVGSLQKLLDRKLTWRKEDVAGNNRAGMTPKTLCRVSYHCPFYEWEIPGGGDRADSVGLQKYIVLPRTVPLCVKF